MAKTKRRSPTGKPPVPVAPPPTDIEVLTPQRVCELLGRPVPLDPPPGPPPKPGYMTYWDPGLSLRDWKRDRPNLFHPWLDWYDDLPLARRPGLAGWRQARPEPAALDEPFLEQEKALGDGEAIPTARDAVAFHLLRFLATGARLACRVRVADVLDSGRRVLVGPLRETGLELANCGDRWASPGTGLAAIAVPSVG